MTICGNCGSTEMEDDNGMLVCTQCGAVVEDQVIVSEIQFQENSGGGVVALGQFVSSEGKHARVAGSRSYGHRDSRQYTLDNGRTRIQNLACNLNMSSYCADVAYNYFKLAVSKGLTKGRKSIHVAAACLYIVCRTEKKPLMLLDFSDKLGIDVYTLGHTYLQLSKDLYITIPAIDPALYIERYAHKMEYGDKMMDVCRTATRLVSRMGRDWMVQGRRPSGICGAALLVASRIFDFNRTVHDVMRVVRIGQQTIKKRLSEFEQTPSSQLTIEEFNNINLETAMDPPCFIEAKKKAKLLELEENGELPRLLEMTEALRDELDVHIQHMIDKKNRRFKKHDSLKGLEAISTEAPSTTELEHEIAQYEHLLALVPDVKDEGKKRRKKEGGGNGDDEEEDDNDDDEADEKLSILKGVSGDALCDKGESQGDHKHLLLATPVEETEVVDGLVAATIKHLISSPEHQAPLKPPSFQPSDLPCKVAKVLEDEKEGTADNDFADLDDDEEIKEIILSEEEVKIKMTLWMRENADFLKVMKEKEEKKARELQENPELGKKKRRTRKMKPRKEANTTEEAIAQIVQLKKLSNKINYDVLVDFNLDSLNNNNNNNNNNKIENNNNNNKIENIAKNNNDNDNNINNNKITNNDNNNSTTNKNKKNTNVNINTNKAHQNIIKRKLERAADNNKNSPKKPRSESGSKPKIKGKTCKRIEGVVAVESKSIGSTSSSTKSIAVPSTTSKEDEVEEVDESFFFEQEEQEDSVTVHHEEETFDTYTDAWDD